jgi:hypothetical protein
MAFLVSQCNLFLFYPMSCAPSYFGRYKQLECGIIFLRRLMWLSQVCGQERSDDDPMFPYLSENIIEAKCSMQESFTCGQESG